MTGFGRRGPDRAGAAAISAAIGLVLSGVIGTLAWAHGLWGLLAGAVLVALWIGALNWSAVVHPHIPAPLADAPRSDEPGDDAMVLRMLLDAVPTPLLAIDGNSARTLNRAARRLFATDDRVSPVPPGLLDRAETHLRHEGRGWRLDRVDMIGGAPGRAMIAMIDIEQEERVAEARATAELMQVLGHELLNGFAPIVSLAESGLAALESANDDPALLGEILGTLARRVEGLQRFTAAYRALARLPEPSCRPVPVRELVDDLARLFAVRWPDVTLTPETPQDLVWALDRDQVSQALWALLQNAAEAVSADRADRGQVRLSVRALGSELAIEVRDNGGGVPPAVADRIFRPFHTTKPDGTGIGLSLAKQIAHAHGGALTLCPEAETTFRIVLPQR
jgi:signal transduction histidine kinase